MQGRRTLARKRSWVIATFSNLHGSAAVSRVPLAALASVATARRIHWTLTSSAPTLSILAKSATSARKSSLDPSQAAEMTQAMAGGQTAGALAGTAAGMAAGASDPGDFLSRSPECAALHLSFLHS